MENLFLSLQKNKQFKRQILILRHLNSIPYKISTNQLAQIANCSLPTVRDDIESLNMDLVDYIEISYPSFGDVILMHKKETTINALITILTKKTIVYQIIDSIFHNRVSSFQSALLHLSVSRTHLQQVLRYMNRILKSFRISISAKGFSFNGREEDIRVFLFSFYSEFGDRSIVSKDSSIHVKQFLQMYTQANLPSLYFCHFRLALWTSITRLRRESRHFVNLPKEVIHEVIERDSFLKFSTAIQAFYQKQSLQKTLSIDEVVWKYITALDCIAYTNVVSFMGTPHHFAYRWEENPDIIAEAHQFLGNVFPQTKELIETNMLDILEAYLVNLRLLSKVSPNFEIMEPELKVMTVNMYTKLYSTWHEQLVSLPHDTYFKFSKLDDIAVSLTLFHASILKQKQRTKKLHILFAFQGRVGFDDYLAKFSQTLVTENIRADYFLEQVIDEEAIVQSGADLVVCNYDLHIEEENICPIIRIPNIPSFVDWGKVRNIIEQLTH